MNSEVFRSSKGQQLLFLASCALPNMWHSHQTRSNPTICKMSFLLEAV